MYTKFGNWQIGHLQKQNFGVLMLSGAYGPPKAAKEHVTCIACWTSSQSKPFARYPPYQEGITFLFEAIFNFVGGGGTTRLVSFWLDHILGGFQYLGLVFLKK